MDDLEKVIKGLECIDMPSDECLIDNCPYEGFGPALCLRQMIKDAIALLKEQDRIIAALQCALDKANEKLAYVSGEKCYHYDCEAGREQLEAWWSAVKHEEQEPIKPLIAGSVEIGSWWYECSNCGTPIDPSDNFCRKCGHGVKWE